MLIWVFFFLKSNHTNPSETVQISGQKSNMSGKQEMQTQQTNLFAKKRQKLTVFLPRLPPAQGRRGWAGAYPLPGISRKK